MPQSPAVNWPPLFWGPVAALAGLKLLLHGLSSLWRYGYFRDELYFLDCGRHLDWGYVDHAPLIGVYARLALALGGSLPALRLLSAVAGALVVVLAALIARELGGGRLAQGLAALATVVSPIRLTIDSIMSMNAFEPLFWLGAMLCLLRRQTGGDPRWWLGFGLLAGLGLENKHSTLFFGAAVLGAVLLSPERRDLLRPWIWLAGVVALLLFLPNLLWQWRNGFPTLVDLRNVQALGKNVVVGPGEFVAQQALIVGPHLLPLWLGGLWHLLAGRGRRWRLAGWSYLALVVLFIAFKAKHYYLAPIYPLLFAAGAVAFEGQIGRRWPGRRWPARAVAGALAACGAAVAPAALPLLSPGGLLEWSGALGAAPPRTEVAHQGPLPQIWGDQHGWPELVAEVARVYHALPAGERARAGILAGNYGEAGAINHLGPPLGLPRAVSGHQSYHLWGPGRVTGEVVIVLQSSRERLETVCASVEEVGRHAHPWGMAEENGAIWLCRGLDPPLAELWPRLRHWN